MTQGKQGIQGKRGRPGRNNIIPYIMVTLAFTFAVVLSEHASHKAGKVASQNRDLIKDLQDTKANVDSLRKSNCTLRQFLAIARKARFKAAQDEYVKGLPLDHQSDQYKTDRAAYLGYNRLMGALDGEKYCPLPAKLRIKGESSGLRS